MNTLQSLLAGIISNPDEDMPRLLYAEGLDELEVEYRKCTKCNNTGKERFQVYPRDQYGEAEYAIGVCQKCQGTKQVVDTTNHSLAQYIRKSIEFMNHKNSCKPRVDPILKVPQFDSSLYGPAAQMSGMEYYQKGIELDKEVKELAISVRNHPLYLPYDGLALTQIERGFIHSIRCTATQFLAIADRLIWHESMTNKCKGCERCKDGSIYIGIDGMKWIPCTIKVQRPCPLTAHPVRKVEITDRANISEVTGENLAYLIENDLPKYGIKVIFTRA